MTSYPPHIGILTSCPSCMTIFSPHMTISHLTSTLCPPHVTISHLAWTFSPHMTIFSTHIHLVWTFSPLIHLMWPFPTLHSMDILTSHPPCIHLVWPFLTLHGHSHLASTSYRHSHLMSILCNHILTSCDHFPSCVGILTCVHLMWPFPTSHGHSHLVSTSCDHFAPCMGILTSHPPCVCVVSCPLHQAKVTLHDHSYLTWQLSLWHPPCMPSCWVVPSITQKSPCVTILTWCGNSHPVST